MKELIRPDSKIFKYSVVSLTYVLYMWVFAFRHHDYGMVLASLAIFPVTLGSWYFGVSGGLTITILSIFTDVGSLLALGHPLSELSEGVGYFTGNIILFFVAVIVGRMATVMRERAEAIRKLQQYEKDQRERTDFLELLNGITARALEADSLQTTLEILTEQIARLFKADDGFFAFWDEEMEVTIPTVAYGSMQDIYPYFNFKPGEHTLGTSIMKEERPIPVPDMDHSPHISPEIASLYPSRSMLGIPLIAQARKLGALLLGYTRNREFSPDEIRRAAVTGEQLALVLSKSLLLEEERKQVKQLTALHDVALISVEVDNEDQLIERVTDVIGKNLFPDNFGILLLDDQTGMLHPHPSYRFYALNKIELQTLKPGEGISGLVARDGKTLRFGDVRTNPHYLDMDDRTISELCVPIKIRERVLGVINAESTKRNAFTVDDERLLTTLAGQLATAIEQTRKAHAERKWLDQLAHSNDLIYAIAQITTHIERALTMDDIIQTLGQELRNIGLTCIMAVHDGERRLFTINYTSLEPRLLEIIEQRLRQSLVNYNFTRLQLEQAVQAKDILQPAVIPNAVEEIQTLFTHTKKTGVVRLLGKIGVALEIEPLRLPLVFEDNLLGILWVWGSAIRNSDLPILSIFAKQIGISLERARLFAEVQSLALTDPLTGLNNRRSLFELGRIEFSRAQRMKRPFCCMMLDLDHFKQVNDNYGHQVGDEVLQEFARRCNCSVREVDLIGRYGGEELIILLPETDLKIALQVAERLRKTISDMPVKVGDLEINLSTSIGVARMDENTVKLDTLVARADQALYIAKHKGRNCVAVSK